MLQKYAEMNNIPYGPDKSEIVSNRRLPNGEDIIVSITDTFGKPRFNTIIYNYYKQSHGLVVALDLTDKESFTN